MLNVEVREHADAHLVVQRLFIPEEAVDHRGHPAAFDPVLSSSEYFVPDRVCQCQEPLFRPADGLTAVRR